MSVEERNMTDILGINKEHLATSCSKATSFLLEKRLLGKKTQEEFVEFMKESFSPNEMLFLSIGYITDKSNDIMKNDPGFEKMVDEVSKKHGIPPEIVEVVKATLGFTIPRSN